MVSSWSAYKSIIILEHFITSLWLFNFLKYDPEDWKSLYNTYYTNTLHLVPEFMWMASIYTKKIFEFCIGLWIYEFPKMIVILILIWSLWPFVYLLMTKRI